MLVATAAVGFFAPIAAQASDIINIDGMNDYSRSKKSAKRIDSKTFIRETNDDIAVLKGRVDGLEAQQTNFEAGAFSSTTTMDGKAIMWIGGVEGGNTIGGTESAQTGYTYTMNLNTSFSGDDNLYVRLKAGEAGSQWGKKPTYHIDRKATGDAFKLDKMWYTLPVGDNWTLIGGPRIENYYMYITPSIYKPGALKSMKLGGNSNFGASTDVGFGFKWETKSGFGIASNLVDKSADSSTGLLNDGSKNKWDTQIAYTRPQYHASLTLSNAQNWTSQSYNATSFGAAMKGIDGDTTGYALRGYWRPLETGTITPEVSLGYDIKSADNPGAGGASEANSYFVGLTWRDIYQADDRIGIAFTQPLKVVEYSGTCQVSCTDVDPFVWEAYYSFKPNDSMEVRPAIFGGTDVLSDTEDDIFGAVLTSTFKF